MQLTHSFTVPAPVDEAFAVLRDIERIAPCMPGATLGEIDGDRFSGKVKVKVGPIQVTYQGEARFAQVDEGKYRAVLEADAKEARGSGTARATITAECRDRGEQTDVTVFTDLAITGKPAQFGRGVMNDVGQKLLGQFAECLATELASPSAPPAELTQASAVDEPAAPAGADATTGPATSVPAAGRTVDLAATPPHQSDEAIDLLGLAGGPVVKRLGSVLAVAALVALAVWLVRRSR
jgi:carbon monoxide dehydrogenase subunit G